MAAAALFHIGLLWFAPPFAVDLSKADAVAPRLVMIIGDWQPPVCPAGCGNEFVAFDTAWAPPRLTNRGALQMEVPRRYPPLLWRHQEPSHGTFEISIGRSGRVRHVVLLESSDNNGDDALTQLAGMMRFEPMQVGGSRVAVVAAVGLEIRPWDGRAR